MPVSILLGQSLSNTEEASLLAAREIVKHMEGSDKFFELPCEIYSGEEDRIISMDYDDVVDLVEGIIRHYFNLESRHAETASAAST